MLARHLVLFSGVTALQEKKDLFTAETIAATVGPKALGNRQQPTPPVWDSLSLGSRENTCVKESDILGLCR